MLYFTSDTHFFHKRMLDFRPFESVEEMNEKIIENWNKTVSPKDEVYHLGDVTFGSREDTWPLLKRLNGRINLVLGNHDKHFRTGGAFFESVQDYKELKINKQIIVLMHFPILKWNRAHYGSIHLHGHSHGNLPDEGIRRFDVGVDVFDYTPVSLDYILERAEERPVAEYHH